MRLLGVILALFALSLAAPGLGQQQPPLPYVDQGARPFEGCIYREWTARQAIVAHAEPRENLLAAFTIEKGQAVTAETGFVLTTKVGVTKVLKQVTMGYDKRLKKLLLGGGPTMY
jgi:hypothetical protein